MSSTYDGYRVLGFTVRRLERDSEAVRRCAAEIADDQKKARRHTMFDENVRRGPIAKRNSQS